MEGKLKAIYEPTGQAREYNPLACNLYSGCSHGCVYCYAPAVLQRTREKFAQARPRAGILEALNQDSAKLSLPWNKPADAILLSFTSDCYQPEEETAKVTRMALECLKHYGLRVAVLTKAGPLARRDLDLLTPDDKFGVTLTCDNEKDSQKWEPGAGLPAERIENLRQAKARGIQTFVSLEPVLYPEQVLRLIDQTHEFVDEYKVGKLNYHPHAKTIDWAAFTRDVEAKLRAVGARYYLKKDLQMFRNTWR